MIGIYDYTVILTYLSVFSAVVGTFLAFTGHSLGAVICLMLSGLFDMFDGKVARTKKRQQKEINYGIQIDSLADMIAFGILPVAIGFSIGAAKWYFIPVACLYTLGALIRLAHFNVNEEEVSKTKKGRSTSFVGLPTTSVALIIPFVYYLKHFVGIYFPYVYTAALLIIAILFVIKLEFVTKPDNKRMFSLLLIGLVELILIVLGYKLWNVLK